MAAIQNEVRLAVLKPERLDLGRKDAPMIKHAAKVMLLLIETATSGRTASLQTCPVHPNTDGSNPE